MIKRKLKIILLSIFSLLLFGYFGVKYLVPYFAKPKIKQLVEDQIGSDLQIESLSFEPIGLQIKLEKVKLAKTHFLKSLLIDLSVEGLLSKKLTVSSINLENIELKLKQTKTGFELLNFTLPKKDEKSVEKEGDKKINWAINLKQIDIRNSKIEVADGPTLNLDFITFSHFMSSNPPTDLKIKAQASLEKTLIKLNGSIKNYFEKSSGKLEFDLKELNLNLLNTLSIGNLKKIEGVVDLAGEMSFGKDNQSLTASLRLQNFKYYSADEKVVDYFVKDLNLANANLAYDSLGLNIATEKLEIENLILSIPAKKLTAMKNYTRYSQIKYDQISGFIPHQLTEEGVPLTLSIYQGKDQLLKLKQSFQSKMKKLSLKISGMSLLPFSDTFNSLQGYHINSGSMDLKYKTTTANKNVKGKVEITLKQFKLADENEDGKKIKNDDTIPLPTAISLIKNDAGVIELELDISGNESDPEFGFIPLLKSGIGSVLMTKFTGIVATKAATRFLPLLVSSIPFSPANAFMIVSGGYKFLSKPRFQDLQFKPNSIELIGESQKTLKKVINFLENNKKLNFEFCPIANLSEGTDKSIIKLNKQQSLDLAQKRIKAIQTILDQEYAKNKQIHFCRPQISEGTSEFGVIKISL